MRSRLILLLLIVSIFAVTPASEAALLIVANKSDDTVDLIDPSSGESLATIATGHAPHEVETSPDGRFAIVANYGDRSTPGSTLTVIDLRAKKAIQTIDLGKYERPHGLAWLEGSRVAVTTEGSRHLIVVDVASGKVIEAISTGQDVSHMVAVDPTRERAFVANIGSGSVTVIDLASREKLMDITTGAGAEGVAARPGEPEVWVTNRDEGTISVIDSKSLEIVATIPSPGFPIRIEFTPDGSHALVSAASAGEVVRIDAALREEIARARLDLTTVSDDTKRLFSNFGDSPVPVGIQFSANGSRAYIAATQSDAVVVIDPATLEVLDVIRAGREPDGMAWSE